MFKLMNRCRNKKGFTIVELLVTVAVLSLVVLLSWQLFSTIWAKYQLVEDRYIIQTEVQYVLDAFQSETAKTVLSSSTKVDLFHEDMIAAKSNNKFESCYDELGTFSDDGNGTLTFEKTSSGYSYFINYDGYLYVLTKGNNEAHRFYFNEEIKLDVTFSIATDAFSIDSSKGKENTTEKVTDEEGSDAGYREHKYVEGLTVSVESSDDYLPNKYQLSTSYALNNLGSSKINVSGNNLTNTYVAGWDAGISDAPAEKYKDTEKTYEYINESANIIRFISQDDAASGEFSGLEASVNMNINLCTTTFLMAGTDVGDGVVDTIRTFRDEVLKGNAVGEYLIDKYYEYSPAIIEAASESPALKKALQTFVKGFAYTVEIFK